jgi:hypothetical protein
MLLKQSLVYGKIIKISLFCLSSQTGMGAHLLPLKYAARERSTKRLI